MTIITMITYLSMLVWALTLFKQNKTSYFNFFLINAVMDPIARILQLGFHLMPLSFYPAFILLKSFSLTKRYKSTYVILLCMIVLSISLLLGGKIFWLYLLCLILSLMIFFVLVNKLIEHINQTKSFSLFLIMLIFYQLINLLKYAAILLDLYKGVTSFYLAAISQILLGIGFIFVNINTKNFPIKLEKF